MTYKKLKLEIYINISKEKVLRILQLQLTKSRIWGKLVDKTGIYFSKPLLVSSPIFN